MTVKNKSSYGTSQKGYLVKITISLLFCLSVFDVQTRVCQQLCLNDGFENGLYSQKLKKCFCLEARDLLKEKRIKLSSKYKKERYNFLD